MTPTQKLIDDLVNSARPVRRLRSPLIRTAYWVTFAAVLLILISVLHGLRSDLALKLQQPAFVIAMTGALLTGILSAVTSFSISVPGSRRSWLLLPLPALALWFSSIGYGCLTDWVKVGPDGIRMGEAVQCFATLLLTGLPLSAALIVMLRFAAFIQPKLVCCTAGLAVAALTAFAVSLFHDLDATMMILIWNVGVAAVFSMLAGALGERALKFAMSKLA